MHVCLPNELLVDIVESLFEEPTPAGKTHRNTSDPEAKPPWSRIHAVVLASHSLRAIGLKLWFTRLRVKNDWNWEYMSSIPGIYNWVKDVSYYNVTSILIPDIHPAKFQSLEGISIRMFNIDRPMGIINRLPQSVRRLELWKFDTMVHDQLFSALAARLPGLRELRLHGMSEVDKYGLGTLFTSADTFGRSMASALSQMQRLEILAMDVYLTPSSILLHHTSCPHDQSLVSCDTCIRNFSDETDANEADVSLLVAATLKSLKRAEWCSCFSRKSRSVFLVKRDEGENGVVSVSRQND